MTTESVSLDPRINAFRPDLADAALQAIVKASRYIEPQLRQCLKGVVPMLAEPKNGAAQISEIRYGEFIDVFEFRLNGFAWVKNRTDQYVGYIQVDKKNMSEEIAKLGNRINVLHTFVYPKPNIKTTPVDRLTLGSYVEIIAREDKFIQLPNGGYVFAKHVASTEESLASDYVFTAGRMLGVPYYWGGRSALGLDCSALVQLSLELAGIDCPRDTDQQCGTFGKPLPSHWQDMAWRRGDIVFISPSHVGIMTSHSHIIHASGHDMQVVVEPLAKVVARYNEITAYGRF